MCIPNRPLLQQFSPSLSPRDPRHHQTMAASSGSVGQKRRERSDSSTSLSEKTPLQAKADGPRSASEVFDWPLQLLKTALSVPGGPSLRLRAMCRKHEWQLTSDYSGFDCPREAVRLGHLAVSREIGACPTPKYVRACDVGGLQQKILCEYANKFDAGESCVFQDINARLPEEARRVLDELEPSAGASFAECIKARQAQHTFLVDNKQRLFHESSESWCLVHKKMCLTLPRIAPALSDDPSEQVFRVNVAGTCCQAWSMEGKRAKHGHPSERPHSIWQLEREMACRLGLEDAFVQECTPAYDAEKLAGLQETHFLHRIITAPLQLGYPCRRRRSWIIGLAKERFDWHGPEFFNLTDHFHSLFAKNVMVDGDVFLNADPEDPSLGWLFLPSVSECVGESG